jgi:hypothetical protein
MPDTEQGQGTRTRKGDMVRKKQSQRISEKVEIHGMPEKGTELRYVRKKDIARNGIESWYARERNRVKVCQRKEQTQGMSERNRVKVCQRKELSQGMQETEQSQGMPETEQSYDMPEKGTEPRYARESNIAKVCQREEQSHGIPETEQSHGMPRKGRVI